MQSSAHEPNKLPPHLGSTIPDPEVPPGVEVVRDVAFGEHERQSYDIYLPQNAEGPLPVVVYIHSGGWRRRDKRAIRTMFVLDQGYALVSIGYRLVQHAIFPAPIHDVNDGLRHLIEHGASYGLDTDRLVIAGTSAGAHLSALAVLGRNSEALKPVNDFRPLGVIAAYGCYDLPYLLEHPELHERDHFGADAPLVIATGGDPAGQRHLLELMSPQAYVTADAPPFYVLHGTADPVLPFSQSANFAAAMATAGARIAFEPVPGAGHGDECFRQPPISDRMMLFINEVMSSAP